MEVKGMGNLLLEFLPNPGGEEEGLGHAGIETFRYAPYASAAREAGQNSRDASATLPVRVHYDLFELDRHDVPCVDQLHAALQRCMMQQLGDKEKAFFEQAQLTINAERIKVLRISDFNTTGAKGPSRPGTAFHSLLKGSGVSVKSGIASGGSFGIGKNAAYAISDLQAVFYSTVYRAEGGSSAFLSQGKVVLISHQDLKGIPRRQTGYWGDAEYQPVAEPSSVPEWLRRSELGTSVFVIGFRETADWSRTFALSLIQNFFPAIAQGEMEFLLDEGKYSLTKASLGGYFVDPQLVGLASKLDQASDFELSHQLYRCLTHTTVQEATLELSGLGRVRVRVMLGDGLPKKVFLVRNGMLITDSLEHFGDKFSRFPMYKDFVALVMPSEDKGSAFIKKLEDPKHKELSAERIPDPKERENVKSVMKSLAKQIRETIKSHALTSFDKAVSLDEMRRYFSKPVGPDSGGEPKEENPEKLRYEVLPKKSRSPSAVGKGDDGSGGGTGDDSAGAGPSGPGADDVGGEGNAPSTTGGGEPARKVKLGDLRNVIPAGSREKRRMVYFTPETGGSFEVALYALGVNTPEKLSIVEVRGAELVDGRIRAVLAAGSRARIEVELKDAYGGPIDVVVTVSGQETENEA